MDTIFAPYITKEKEGRYEECKVVARQDAEVSVPVKVKPRVETGRVAVRCCGEAKVMPVPCIPIEKPLCPDGECCFILTQRVSIDIPIEISAEVLMAQPFVECECGPQRPSEPKCDPKCGDRKRPEVF